MSVELINCAMNQWCMTQNAGEIFKFVVQT